MMRNFPLLDSSDRFDEDQVQEIIQNASWNAQDDRLALKMAQSELAAEGLDITDPSYESQVLSLAEENLAKLQLTRQAIAAELGTDAESLVSVPQGTFHLDMEVRPLGDGKVMLSDPRLTNHLIDSVNSENGKLDYMKFSYEEIEVLGPKVDLAKQRLEEAGFEVVLTPGNNTSGPHNDIRAGWNTENQINIMNGTIGQSPTGDTVYITNASRVPEVDAALTGWLKDNTDIDHVEMIRHDHLTAVGGRGGWDCMTLG